MLDNRGLHRLTPGERNQIHNTLTVTQDVFMGLALLSHHNRLRQVPGVRGGAVAVPDLEA
jgi:hypothetical protein